MGKYYIVFTRTVLPQPDAAHLVRDVNSANAAANLRYATVLVYLQRGLSALDPRAWLHAFRPREPDDELAKFYNIQECLQVATLPIPWPIDRIGRRWINSIKITTEYFFPVHILPHAGMIHTPDWDLIKAAVRNGVPVIYERDHYRERPYEPDIVNSPLFQVTVTVDERVRENMIQNGMPPGKILKLHNGVNRSFFTRQPEAAEAWREQLLGERQYLVVYSGALYRFKGVDLLIDAARELPHIQFVLAGGSDFQVRAYRKQSAAGQAGNVTFLGHVTHERLVSLLQAADALVYPHCSGNAATLGSPLKFFEYLASGAPMVATEVPHVTEFKLSQLVIGWCPPDNVGQLARSIEHTLMTYPRRMEGYSASIQFARQFSWENRMSTILSHVDGSMRPHPVRS